MDVDAAAIRLAALAAATGVESRQAPRQNRRAILRGLDFDHSLWLERR